MEGLREQYDNFRMQFSSTSEQKREFLIISIFGKFDYSWFQIWLKTDLSVEWTSQEVGLYRMIH